MRRMDRREFLQRPHRGRKSRSPIFRLRSMRISQSWKLRSRSTGDDLPARLRAAEQSGHIDAPLDFFGGRYVTMAVEDLGIPRDRIDTIANFDAAKRFVVQPAGGAD